MNKKQYNDCFVNEFDNTLFFNLKDAKKNYRTKKFTSALLIGSGVASGAGLTAVTALAINKDLKEVFISLCITAVAIFSIPFFMMLNHYSNIKCLELKGNDFSDFFNYEIYKNNKNVENFLERNRARKNSDKLVSKKLESNLNYLLSLNEEVKGLEKSEQLSEKNASIVCENIKKHINQNLNFFLLQY